MRALIVPLSFVVFGCAATGPPPWTMSNPHNRTNLQFAGVDSVAVDTLRFLTVFPSASAGADWQCGEATAIVVFAGGSRAGGAVAYWSAVPKGTQFTVVEEVHETERWLCLTVQPTNPR